MVSGNAAIGAAATVPELGSVRQISTGTDYGCAVGSDGTLRCWGYNGLLRIDPSYSALTVCPPRPVPGVGTVRQVSDRCVLSSDGGAVQCFGASPYVTGASLSSNGREISANSGHWCALDSSGSAWCLGYNSTGDLGDGTLQDSLLTPVAVASSVAFVHIVAGANYTCAVGTDANAWCWGQGGFIGDGTEEVRRVPTRVANISGVVRIAAGSLSTCAVLNDGSVWCWGEGYDNQLHRAPERVGGLAPATDVGVSESIACAILRDATVWCWGYVPSYDGVRWGTTLATVPVQAKW